MTPRYLLPLLLCALLGACATTGNAGNTPVPATAIVAAETLPAATEPVVASEVVAEAPAQATSDDTASIAQAEPAAPALPEDAATAEDDFAAIYGVPGAEASANGEVATTSTVRDPWEKYNRHVHAFNQAIDRVFAKPVAQAYVALVPQPIRLGIGNVLNNLGQPVTLANNLLQGDPRGAANTLGRFMLNSTLGIAGIFDLATKVKIPARREDFGQTLAVWGWKQSRYVELPFLGPRTVRDVLGIGGDFKLWPVGYIEHDRTRVTLEMLELVDSRSQLLSIDGIGEGAVDEYTLFRDVWLQRRNYQINHAGRRTEQGEDAPATPDLPSYLLEDEDVTPEQTSDKPAASPTGG